MNVLINSNVHRIKRGLGKKNGKKMCSMRTLTIPWTKPPHIKKSKATGKGNNQTMIGIKWTNEGTMKNHLRMMKKWIGTFKNGEHVVVKTRHTLPIMVKNNG